MREDRKQDMKERKKHNEREREKMLPRAKIEVEIARNDL